MEMPLVPVLARMERAGITLDPVPLGTLGAELGERIQELAGRIHELSGGPFDLNSPKQLAQVLFDRLMLTPQKKTGRTGQASTRAEVLEALALEHEVPRLVLEYRELAKLKNTYVDPLPGLISPETGRLHTRLHQTGASTGRLSSSDPNLQNIPIRTELGRRVRRAFLAPPGKRLIAADYSQIELRVLAHMSEDPGLIEAFGRGEDIHARTAAAVFSGLGLPAAEARRRAKIINFSIIYGKTAFTLGREIGVSTGEAADFIEAYFERYAGVRKFIHQTIEEARRNGRVKTLYGRERQIPDISAQHRQRRLAAERLAVNAPIQGTRRGPHQVRDDPGGSETRGDERPAAAPDSRRTARGGGRGPGTGSRRAGPTGNGSGRRSPGTASGRGHDRALVETLMASGMFRMSSSNRSGPASRSSASEP